MDQPSVPLVAIPPSVVSLLEELGASAEVGEVAGYIEFHVLYRAIANQPEVLLGWIDLAWRLRLKTKSSRRMRELMIVRGAMLSGCQYELQGHQKLARANGVSEEELDALSDWRRSPFFTAEERAALALSEAMHKGEVPDDVLKDLESHFDPATRIELIVTCGFYNMVPRVVNALRVTPEQRTRVRH